MRDERQRDIERSTVDGDLSRRLNRDNIYIYCVECRYGQHPFFDVRGGWEILPRERDYRIPEAGQDRTPRDGSKAEDIVFSIA